MAKIFFFILSFAGAFCLGQWSALEGHTLKKAVRWAESQGGFAIPSVDLESLLKRAGLSQYGSFFRKGDTVRKVTPVRPVPGKQPYRGPHASASESKTSTQAPPPDEEGLSPTDREALLHLLK